MLSLFCGSNYSIFSLRETDPGSLFVQQATISLHLRCYTAKYSRLIQHFSCSSSVISYFSRKPQSLLLQNGVQRTRFEQKMCSLLLHLGCLCRQWWGIHACIHMSVFCIYLHTLISMILIQNHMVHLRRLLFLIYSCFFQE